MSGRKIGKFLVLLGGITSLICGPEKAASQAVNPITSVQSTAYADSLLVNNQALSALWGWSLSTTANGFFMIFDAKVKPTAGATSGLNMLRCYPIQAGTPYGGMWPGNVPLRDNTGFYFAFSSGADCTTLTYSATAWFQGDTQ